MTVILTISDAVKKEAEKHSIERMNYEYNRFHLNNEQRLSMIEIGTIGQLMFKEYISGQGVNYDFEYQAGNYDQMDFKIDDDIVEIKTSGYGDDYSRLNLLYSDDQYQAGLRKGFKYCVQMFIDGYDRNTRLLNLDRCKKCVIAGYLPFQDIAKFPNQRMFLGDDYRVPLNKLIDIAELVKEHKNG